MEGSPPKTSPYPHQMVHPFPGHGTNPNATYANFPMNMHQTSAPFYNNPFHPDVNNPDDRAPPPIGFIYPGPTDPVALSYTFDELHLRESEPQPDLESEPEPEPEPEPVPVKPRHQPVEIKEKIGNFRWIGASASSCNLPGALLCGHDADGSEIYAGRAYHMGDMVPAKVIPSKQVAYIAYGGEEIVKDQFELLCPPSIQWIPSSSGVVPANAVAVGTTGDGEPLYFGRVHHEGGITPGKVQPSHGVCYYPFDGEERNSVDYEVLVIS